MSGLMKAGQWDPKQKSVVINRVKIPEPGPNQILVKIVSASLCHSDLKALQIPGDEPQTLGHEGAGLIAKLHPSSEGKGFQVDDAIGFLYHIGSCHECEGCQVHSAHCVKGCKVQGITAPGFFAQYAVVEWRNAIHIPQTWNLKSSSVFFCAGLTGKIDLKFSSLSSDATCSRSISIPYGRFLPASTGSVARCHWYWRCWTTGNSVRPSDGY